MCLRVKDVVLFEVTRLTDRRIYGWEENGQGIFATAVSKQAMDLGGQGFLDLG